MFKSQNFHYFTMQAHPILSLVVKVLCSVTKLGDLLHFGQLFKACGNNYFTQIDHILRNFCEGVKIFHFSSEINFGATFVDTW